MPRAKRAAQVPGAAATPQAPETAPAAAAPEAAAPAAAQRSDAGEPGRDYSQLRAADVDPHKIKRAVLTLDGWVCPATVPSPTVKQ